MNIRGRRAQDVGSDLKDRIGPAARQTRDRTAQGVLVVRSWGAPRLRRAAGYVEGDLAPRVGSMLNQTALRVEPPSRRGRRVRTVALTALGLAAAIGVVGVAMTRRTTLEPHVQEASPDEATHTGSHGERERAHETARTPRTEQDQSRSTANGKRP